MDTQKIAKNFLDKGKWRLKKDAIVELNEIRKHFIVTYWKIMKRYGMPDSWRITEKQFNRFIAILKDNDKQKKLRKLLRMKTEMAILPTYWYEVSLSAFQVGNKDILAEANRQYELLNVKLLRNNGQYSLMLANEVTYLDPEKQKERILDMLNTIHKVDPLDPERKLFSAMEYALIGDLRKAENLLDENIDDEFLPAVSRKMKLELYLKENRIKKYEETINILLEKQNLSVLEYLSFLGDKPTKALANEIMKEVNSLHIGIDKTLYGKDDLIIQLPKKWVYRNISDTNLIVVVGDEEYKLSKMQDGGNTIIYTFEDLVSYKKIKEREIDQIILKIIYKDLPVLIGFDVIIEKPDVEYMAENIENNNTNTSSLFESSLSYIEGKKAEIYNKGQNLYRNYYIDVKFIAKKIILKQGCFDIENRLKQCKE
jgi:hypothetical protein